MRVEIDEHSGCCHGVRRAIEQAESVLGQRGTLFSLGAIVHNDTEMDRLRQKGLLTIGYEDLKKLKDTVVLFRAHGEPPAVYDIASGNNITVVDCTCPVVLQLQKKIATTYHEISPMGGQIIIFGKNGHAEVNGLIGQVSGQAIVIEKVESLPELIATGKIDLTKPIALFSQTTKDPHQFQELGESLRSAVISTSGDDTQLSVFNTICRQVSSRHPNLIEFAKGHSIIIFVCGKESSNGKILSQLCKSVNPRTYSVEHHQEIDPDWFAEGDFIGICGATSTPKWQLEEVANYLKNL
jgi:4-hydroxy-3-methylbut-2-enyl diphosphate reductase